MMNLPPYPSNNEPQWRGLTLEEMQMRRALVQARMEIQKFKLNAQIERYRSKAPVFGGANSLFSRVTSAFTLAEYGFFALRLFKMAAPLFRKKK